VNDDMTSAEMARVGDGLRQQVLRDYEQLEPGETDTWNPVEREGELTYRLSMFYAQAVSLGLSRIPRADLRVLDVGTGNGRSTRSFIDLGLRPEQLTGIDLRPGAIALARRLHPGISFDVYDGERIDAPDGAFNWVQIACVHATIADPEHRLHVARECTRVLEPGGYLFYFDNWVSDWLAGHEVLDPVAIHPELEVVWSSPIRSHQCLPRVRNRMTLIGHDRSFVGKARAFLRPRTRIDRLLHPSHFVMLARRPM